MTTTTMLRWVGVLLLATAGLDAQTESPPAAATKPASAAKLSDAAKAGLRQAKELAAKTKGLKGPARQAALEAAAARYETLAGELDGEAPAQATAWFEAGELWRRHGSLAKAETSYGSALGVDTGRYRERALFELAQMQRRQKKLDAAIENYAKAAKVKPTSNRAHTARLWIARCLESKGDAERAVASFRAALEASERPVHVIEVCNFLARALIKTGDLDGAGAALEHAGKVARPVIDAGGKDGARVRKALDKMSARRALQRAQDKANGAAKDAAQLEKDRDAARRRGGGR